MMIHDKSYSEAIDPVDNCYAPFSGKHALSLLTFFLLYHTALFCVWIKGRNLPPLTLVLMLSVLFIGCIVNIVVIVQLISHHTESVDAYTVITRSPAQFIDQPAINH
jgi:hypothetical protein